MDWVYDQKQSQKLILQTITFKIPFSGQRMNCSFERVGRDRDDDGSDDITDKEIKELDDDDETDVDVKSAQQQQIVACRQ